MGFKVGDRVKILDEPEEGVISELLSGNRAMVEIDGFGYEYHLSELIGVDNEMQLTHHINDKSFEYLFRDNPVDKQGRPVVYQVDVHQRISSSGVPEIDLHIHELVDKPKQLTNSEMLAIQIQKLEHFIQGCMAGSVSEFVVIHGVGEGVLRTEVRKVLESHGNIEYHDADFGEYGYGATHARIRGLFSPKNS